MIRRRPLAQTSSSNVAIGAATAFLAFAGALSVMGGSDGGVGGWRLRGALEPHDEAPPSRLPAHAKPV